MFTENPLYRLPLPGLFEKFSSSQNGLAKDEALRRLARYGPNEPLLRRRRSGIFEFLLLLANPLILILLIASVITALLGEMINASIIVTIVFLGVSLNYFQTTRSNRAAEKLQEIVAPMATVLRDGQWEDHPRRDLVPGDVIRLGAGDLVPADARLIEARDLHLQQAALTGESLPVEKDSGKEDQNMVFLGSSVVSGTGLALVVATGRETAFGDIGKLLSSHPPETEFERGSRNFGYLIMETVFILVLFVFMISAAFHRNPLESFLFAIALAVGLTPEFLPMIISVTLSQGAVHMARKKVIVKHLSALQNFGSIDILCSDKTGTLTEGEMTVSDYIDLFEKPSDKLFFYAFLNSHYETGIKSPMDAAILKHRQPEIRGFLKCDEIPFDFERKRLSIAVEDGEKAILIVKGAPEGILERSVSFESGEEIHPLDKEARKMASALYRKRSDEGCRILAVASRTFSEKKVFGPADERELVLLGFIVFTDPPLKEASRMIHSLRRDGVQVKILTGDHEGVARHVCTEVGIDVSRILSGEEISRMTDSALSAVAEKVNLFARVSPGEKNRVILALKRRGHVVGFLGDGINDAPSLQAADVGISVSTGVDVAKEAAGVILLERSLRVLHEGILEGRKAFGNVMKYLLMGTSSNFGNMFSMAGAFLFLPFLPMLPMQILLNNFLYDLAQVSIPTDHVDPSFIKKPRRWNISLIRNFMLTIGPISSFYDFLTFFVLISVFHATEKFFHTGWFVESLLTQTLVLLVIRTAGNPFYNRPSRSLALSVLAIAGVGIFIPFSPVGALLGFVPIPISYLIFLFGATGTYLVIVEMVKRRLMRSWLKD